MRRPTKTLIQGTVNSEVKIDACQSGRPQSLKNSKLFPDWPALLFWVSFPHTSKMKPDRNFLITTSWSPNSYSRHVGPKCTAFSNQISYQECGYFSISSSNCQVSHDGPRHTTKDSLQNHHAERWDSQEPQHRPQLADHRPVGTEDRYNSLNILDAVAVAVVVVAVVCCLWFIVCCCFFFFFSVCCSFMLLFVDWLLFVELLLSVVCCRVCYLLLQKTPRHNNLCTLSLHLDQSRAAVQSWTSTRHLRGEVHLGETACVVTMHGCLCYTCKI